MTSWRAMLLTLMIMSQSIVKIIPTNGNVAAAIDENTRSQHPTADEDDDDMRRFIQCGVDRCLLHRTLGPVDLLLRCLEQRCAAALPQGSNKVEAGMEKDMGDGEWRTSNDCAAACHGAKGVEYAACLRQSCGTNQRPAISAYCPSICHVISPENLEQCLRRYCPVVDDQEDQGGEPNEKAGEGGETEKRWGNRLNWMKKWGNRVGRRYGGWEPASWSKRWGSRVCLQAHCGSLASNRHAYVACGQNFCSRRRR